PGPGRPPGITVGPKPAEDVFIAGVFGKTIDLGNGPLSCPTQCFFVAKLSASTGQTAWSASLGVSSGSTISLAATADGGVLVAGGFDGALTLPGVPAVKTNGGYDMFVAKLDNGGVCVWHDEFGDSVDQLVNDVAVDAHGMIYITGAFKGTFTVGNYPL